MSMLALFRRINSLSLIGNYLFSNGYFYRR